MSSRQPRVSIGALAVASTLPKRVAPDKCDCLVHCGDDPWLEDGRTQPCARKVREDRELAAALRLRALQDTLADAVAVRLVENGAAAQWIAGRRWFDHHTPSATQPATEVAQAFEYLLLRGMAEQHSHHPHLVRLVPAAQRPTLETTTP